MRRGLALLGLLVAPGVAAARPSASGFNAEGGFGTAGAIGTHAPDLAVGPTLHLALGRDLTSWFGVGASFDLGSHEATPPAPPAGDYVQINRYAAVARLEGHLGAVELFMTPTIGLAYFSSNVLDEVGVTEPGSPWGPFVGGGLGLGYQLENRHWVIGLVADAAYLWSSDGLTLVGGTAFLRYTK